MKGAWLVRGVGLAAVVFVLASAFTPLPNRLAAWLAVGSRLEPAAAIVVLGGEGVQPDGTLSGASLRRTVAAILLHRRGLAPLLVMSGVPAQGEVPSEAVVRAGLARELGVPGDAVLVEFRAHTTREEAARLAERLHPREPGGARRILLVTDSQHMIRARGLFQRAGFEVLPAPTDDTSLRASAPAARLQLLRRVLFELVARLYHRLAGYTVEPEPGGSLPR